MPTARVDGRLLGHSASVIVKNSLFVLRGDFKRSEKVASLQIMRAAVRNIAHDMPELPGAIEMVVDGLRGEGKI